MMAATDFKDELANILSEAIPKDPNKGKLTAYVLDYRQKYDYISDLDEELAYELGVGDEYETYRKELPTRSRNLNVRFYQKEQSYLSTVFHC